MKEVRTEGQKKKKRKNSKGIH